VLDLKAVSYTDLTEISFSIPESSDWPGKLPVLADVCWSPGISGIASSVSSIAICSTEQNQQ